MTRLFLHGVAGIDCGILDPDLGLIGQSWLVDLHLEGPRNAEGMVVDFGIVKPVLREVCRDTLDHRLLVPLQSPALQQETTADGLLLRYAFGAGQNMSHLSPAESVYPVDAPQISDTHLASLLSAQLSERLKNTGVTNVAVSLRETRKATPNAFRYTHGLRQHQGQCQRIGHGHSSLLEISIEGQRNADEEASLAASILNCHVAAAADILEDKQGNVRLGYDAVAGRHELELPGDRIFRLSGEATVENLAEHLAEDCAIRHAGKHIAVTAWEGIGKGATATRN